MSQVTFRPLRRRPPSSSPTCRPLWLATLISLTSLTCVPRERAGEKAAKPLKPAATRAVADDDTESAGAPPPNAAEPAAANGPPGSQPNAPLPLDPVLEAPFSDDFNRVPTSASDLGPNWRVTNSAWSLSNGRLCGENARNHPVWLARRLPKNAIVEFEASSESSDGDIKAEFWGDGRSSATGQSYTDATSYLTIFGGWKNRFHVLARIDEHAPNRQEIKLVPEGADFKRSTVVPNQVYQFHVERRDGHAVRWLVNEVELLTYRDDEPLSGPGHEHFGFNDWQVRLCFDNLRVTPLED